VTPFEMIDMTGKVVIVTGGSQGIGAGCARVLASVGAAVTIVARNAIDGERTAREINSLGSGSCEFVAADLFDLEASDKVVTRVVRSHGRLDCLVNNAATYTGWLPIDEIDLEVADRIMRTNVLAYFALAKAALPHLRVSGGTIVNVGSLGGDIGLWHDSIYAASKGAILSLTRSLAIDEAVHHVRVNAVLPGNVFVERRARAAETTGGKRLHDFLEESQWLGRSGTPQEIGLAVLFLASGLSSFCTGVGLVVSGGLELGIGPKRPYLEFVSDNSWNPVHD
jgi:NAD(P)-dependent dehydrogenase (short-subunit alcohol dehydrogenase family)